MAIPQLDVGAPPDHTLLQFRDWLILNFSDNASTYLHEAVHVVYHRRVCDNPAVFGPHWMDFRGERRWANGAVSGLPHKIALTSPRVAVGKCFLGPAYIHEQIWPEWKDAWQRAERDVEIFDKWFSDRYRGESDVDKQKFMDQVRLSVYRDLEQPFFRDELFATTVEYEARTQGQDHLRGEPERAFLVAVERNTRSATR